MPIDTVSRYKGGGESVIHRVSISRAEKLKSGLPIGSGFFVLLFFCFLLFTVNY